MSARWRRDKRTSGRFNVSKTFNKSKDENSHGTHRLKGLRNGRQVHPRGRRILRISGKRRFSEREPLVDILEENDEILVVAGFVGFDKENLRIRVSSQRLILSAKAVNYRYHKSLNLPSRVIPKTMCVKHKNGVLEIRLKKGVEERAIDKAAG